MTPSESTFRRVDRAVSLALRLGFGIALPVALVAWAIVVLKDDRFSYFGRDGGVWPPQAWRTVHGSAATSVAMAFLSAALATHLGVFWLIGGNRGMVLRRIFSLSVVVLALAVWCFILVEVL